MNMYIDYSEEVKKALDEHRPIVAIETGGTFEGIPYPENAKTALTVMEEVRKAGATPAYIAIMDGRVKVGMNDTEIDKYASMRGTMQKASRREIPQIIAQGKNGVMTIAATMVIADYVGIPVVSGGGIGGVHRGAEVSMDISSDLEEIVERNVIVVCSGAKSILDLNLTMEYLETKAVSVIGYKTDELPAYMARNSGIKLTCRMDDVNTIANTYRIKNNFGIKTGIILANPIDEEYAVDADLMNNVIDEAVNKSIEDKISGKAITGYLMKYVKEKMGSESMEAQKHMIIQNAMLAAEVAATIVGADVTTSNIAEFDRNQLINIAIDNQKNSYAPYSNYNVSAAVLMSSGKIYTGVNVENASYPAGICAERNAISHAIACGENTIEAIAIVGGPNYSINDYCPPCGICRQVMREFCEPSKMHVILAKSPTDYKEMTLEELLPESFGPEML